jgi:type IV pilus assembly protein PilA
MLPPFCATDVLRDLIDASSMERNAAVPGDEQGQGGDELWRGNGNGRRYHPRMERGFTWIEMLMVLSVLALLALIAVPSIQDGLLRRQVKDGIQLALIAEAGVQAVYTSSGGKFPIDNKSAGLPDSDKIVSNVVKDVSVKAGAITITYGNNASKALDGKKVTLRPAIVPDTPVVPIAWLCHAAPVPGNMQVTGTDDTDVPSNWLPVECRS